MGRAHAIWTRYEFETQEAVSEHWRKKRRNIALGEPSILYGKRFLRISPVFTRLIPASSGELSLEEIS